MANLHGKLFTFVAGLLGVVLLAGSVAAHVFPQGGFAELESLGDAEERLERMQRLETHRLGAGRRQEAMFRLARARLEAAGLSPEDVARELTTGPQRAFPFSQKPELPSTGTVETLTVLIDFKGQRATTTAPSLTRAAIEANIYGDGTEVARLHPPFESLRSYYRRASEERFEILGDVEGWVHLPKTRTKYEPSYPVGATPQQRAWIDNQALFDLITAALDKIDGSTDFAEYDNDHDGDIDALTVIYAGPPTGWGGFWWAYRWEFFIPAAWSKLYDGKRLKQFVFQFARTRANGDFDPTVLIHEMGHALGLPDYYDYCSNVDFNAGRCPTASTAGPDGGVGGLDMMAGNRGNHNALSRWLLDWISPRIVASASPRNIKLVPSGAVRALAVGDEKAVAVFPGLGVTNAPNQELFLVENRQQLGNDGGRSAMPGDGVLIWHVDATPNAQGTDFAFDNSYTSRKLIQLERAGHSTDFRAGEAARATDYFRAGDEFTPDSAPSSVDHQGRPTGVSITKLVENGNHVAADIGLMPIGGGGPAPLASRAVSALDDLDRRLAVGAESGPSMTLDLDALVHYERELLRTRPEQIEAIWKRHASELEAGDATANQRVLCELLLTHWAAKDGEAATRAVVQSPPSSLASNLASDVLQAWAANDPRSAGDWYLSSAQDGLRAGRGLSLGSEFTRAVFQWRAATESEPAAAIDRLHSFADIYGAVEGLRTEQTGDLERQLRSLQVKSDEALAIRDLQDAAAHVRELGLEEAELIENVQREDLGRFD